MRIWRWFLLVVTDLTRGVRICYYHSLQVSANKIGAACVINCEDGYILLNEIYKFVK